MITTYGPMIVAAVFEAAVIVGLATALACRKVACRISSHKRVHGRRHRPTLIPHGAH